MRNRLIVLVVVSKGVVVTLFALVNIFDVDDYFHWLKSNLFKLVDVRKG